MKHKSLLTGLIMLLFSISLSAQQGGKCGENLTWLLLKGKLTISGTGAMTDYYDRKDAPWYSYCESITSLSIADGVTSIGWCAFEGCSSLTSVTIPNGVTSIGAYAFSGCSSLTSITIPNSITSIGESAFKDCNSLPVIDNIRYADTYLVETVDKSLSSYTIKDGTKWIGFTAFQDCSKLTSITIPNSVTSIERSAFSGCSRLTSVTIPNSVTSIGNYAFQDCSGLTSITIPESVKSIGMGGTFQSCTALKSVRWNAKICTIDTNDGVHYNPPFYNLSNITSFSFGEEVETIPACLCNNLSSMTAVIIPNSVKTIGKWAFESCGLTSVTIPQSVTTIEDRAFYYCMNLTSINVDAANSEYCDVDGVLYDKDKTTLIQYPIGNIAESYTIPNSVSNIGNGAFAGCCNLITVTIPSSVANIGEWAFENCTGLASVTIPNSVTSIGYNAFSNVNNIMYDGSADDSPWGAKNMNGYVDGWFVYSDASKTKLIACSTKATGEIILPNSVEVIGKFACYNCGKLTAVTIPNNVTSISSDAFINCGGLASLVVEQGNSVYDSRNDCNAIIESASNTLIAGCRNTVIPNDVTAIGDFAFYGCSGLASINIHNNVRSIGLGAFCDCVSLTSVTIPESVVTIGMGGTFQRCTALKEVHWNAVNCTIEPHDEEMNYYYPPFNELENITTFVLGQDVETIPDYLCYDLTGLASVIVPAKVTNIGSYAFSGCTGLTSLTSKAVTPPVCEENVFEKVDKSIPLYVPDESTGAYNDADGWKEFKQILPASLSAIEEVYYSNTLNNASATQTRKVMRDGVMFILMPDGRMYDMQGNEKKIER